MHGVAHDFMSVRFEQPRLVFERLVFAAAQAIVVVAQ